MAEPRAKRRRYSSGDQKGDELLLTSQHGQLRRVNELLRAGAHINFTNEIGFTALMLACHSGHSDVAMRLIGEKADLNAISKEGFTALMPACGTGLSDGA